MQSNKDDSSFIPYKNRETHWGDPLYRPLIPNVATVLPPDLPEPILKALLIRMQIEEANYKLDHLNTEVDHAIWRENTVDTNIWSNQIKGAKLSRAKEVLLKEMRAANDEYDKFFPIILPPPPEAPK